MNIQPVKNIPIPHRYKGKVIKNQSVVWDFEVLTEYEMSKFFPGKTTRQAHNALDGFKRKYNGLYKNRKFTVQAREEEIDGKKVNGIRVWRIDKHANTPEQEAMLNSEPVKRITQTDIHRSINGK